MNGRRLSGNADAGVPYEPCAACRGTGEWADERKCPSCGGTGEVPVAAKVRVTLRDEVIDVLREAREQLIAHAVKLPLSKRDHGPVMYRIDDLLEKLEDGWNV